MGLFNSIIDAYKKREAAALIQDMLEHLDETEEGGALPPPLTPAKLATTLIEDVWEVYGSLTQGKTDPRPHRRAVATIALAKAVERLGSEERTVLRTTLVLALARSLIEVERNKTFYYSYRRDGLMLDDAMKIFMTRDGVGQ